jgi:hypothetical protein
MTIKLLTKWGDYPINSLLTLDSATETAMVADKIATTNLAGGVVVPVAQPALGDQPSRFVSLTNAQFALLTTGRPGWVYELSDAAGKPQYRWNGSAFSIIGSGTGGSLTVETLPSDASPYTFRWVSDTDSDANKMKRWATATALTFNLPDTVTGNPNIPIGTQAVVYVEVGAGDVTFAAQGSAQIVSKAGGFTTNGEKSTVVITLVAPNEWKIDGDLGALTPADISGFNAAVDARIALSGGGLSWSVPGTFANLPVTGAAGTNTIGTHSGNFTVIGTAAAATTSLAGKGYKRRQVITSAAAANSGAGVRSSTTGVCFAPNTANNEVLRGEYTGSSSDSLTGCRGAMGLGWFAGSAPNMANEPNTFTNLLALAYNSGDTQFKVMHNDSAGAATEIVLNSGAGFPCNGADTDYIKFYFRFNGGTTRTIDWIVSNLISGVSVTGTITTNMPDADQLLMAFNYRSTAANTTACSQNYGGCLGGAAVGA